MCIFNMHLTVVRSGILTDRLMRRHKPTTQSTSRTLSNGDDAGQLSEWDQCEWDYTAVYNPSSSPFGKGRRSSLTGVFTFIIRVSECVIMVLRRF